MKILVTGGAGYIGSHTAVELLENGHEVLVMDNLCNSKYESIERVQKITGKQVTFYQTDMLDTEGMRQIFREHKIDAVIHFAGLKAVGESVHMPVKYYHNNITGSLQLLQVMEEFGCKTIVFSSSATVYGMHNQVPYTEEMPTSATNPYGYTKLMVFLQDTCPRLSLYQQDSAWAVGLHEQLDREKLEREIQVFIQKNGGQVDNLSLIYEEIHKKHSSFDIKDYGYSRLSSFLRSIRSLSVSGNTVSLREKK